jgi:uncharacterized protein (DUF58 family)
VTESLLTRVKTRLFLRARRRATHLLEGQYAAIHRGRSMDFDDLREYSPGDEVADIDWNATARSGTTLVRRWADERRNRLCLVVDSGRNMAASSAGGDTKRDIAIMAAGALGYVAVRHGDEVGVITGNADGVQRLPFRATEAALERGLRAIADPVALDGARSDLLGLLERVRISLKQRMFVVVIADEVQLDERLRIQLGALAAAHELIWLEIGDADPFGADGRTTSYDVAGDWTMPASLARSPRLRAELASAARERDAELRNELERRGVSHTRLERIDDAVPRILDLLRARRHSRV